MPLLFFTAIMINWMMVTPLTAAEKTTNPNPSAERSSSIPQMQTIGIIGGVSWVSSLEYYRLMNQMVRNKLGGLNSAQILMYSIEFGEFARQERLADKGDWKPLRKIMIDDFI